MVAEPLNPLAEAAQRRHDQAVERAAAALRRLDAAGQAVTFSAVAAAASVSRSWLYSEPAIRAEIERLRPTPRPGKGRKVPTAQRATEDSLRERLDAAREQITRLREENRRLREQVARRLGVERSRLPVRASAFSRREHVHDDRAPAHGGFSPRSSR